MSIYKYLYNYAMQLVENREVADSIVRAAMERGIEVGMEIKDADKGIQLMIIETRNKSYEYLRNKKPE